MQDQNFTSGLGIGIFGLRHALLGLSLIVEHFVTKYGALRSA